MTLTYEQFVETYAPIQNHLSPGPGVSFEGTMFETFGPEIDYVRDQPTNHVWTLTEEDDSLFIQAGYHYVNRLGYFITANPFTDHDLQIDLD